MFSDGGCAAELHNARLSDDRPIRQFVFAKGAEAYAIERLKKKFLVFLVLRRIEKPWTIDVRQRC
jgi:hypothetical protein